MEKSDISVGITGFIDILGFSDKVIKAESIDDITKIEPVKKVKKGSEYF